MTQPYGDDDNLNESKDTIDGNNTNENQIDKNQCETNESDAQKSEKSNDIDSNENESTKLSNGGINTNGINALISRDALILLPEGGRVSSTGDNSSNRSSKTIEKEQLNENAPTEVIFLYPLATYRHHTTLIFCFYLFRNRVKKYLNSI